MLVKNQRIMDNTLCSVLTDRKRAAAVNSPPDTKYFGVVKNRSNGRGVSSMNSHNLSETEKADIFQKVCNFKLKKAKS
jgi:hypothetical protein